MYREELILSALRERGTWLRFRSVLKPGHFSDTDNRKLYAKLDALHRSGSAAEIPRAAFAADLPDLPQDRGSLEPILTDFATRVRLHDLALAATTARNQTGLLGEGSLTEVLGTVALVEDDLDVRRRIVGESETLLPRIETGLRWLDAALDGGFSVGELVCVGAAPYTGKTHWLTKLASLYAMRNFKTFHFMLEDLPADVLRYYKQAVTLYGPVEAKAVQRSLTILNYNDTATSIDDIDRALRTLVPERYDQPIVVVVDYADIVAVPGMTATEGRFKLKEAYVGMRRLGNKYNAIVLTASQLGAAAWTKKFPDMTDLDESKIGKGGTLDVCMLWSQLLDEKRTGHGRLVLAKARGRRVPFPYLGLHVDWDTYGIDLDESALDGPSPGRRAWEGTGSSDRDSGRGADAQLDIDGYTVHERPDSRGVRDGVAAHHADVAKAPVGVLR